MTRTRKPAQTARPFGDLTITALEAEIAYPGLCARTLQQWRRRGHIEAITVNGRGLLFSAADVERLWLSRFRLFKKTHINL